MTENIIHHTSAVISSDSWHIAIILSFIFFNIANKCNMVVIYAKFRDKSNVCIFEVIFY